MDLKEFGHLTSKQLLDNPELAVEVLAKLGVIVKLGTPNLKELHKTGDFIRIPVKR